MSDPVRLCELRDSALSVDEVLAAVATARPAASACSSARSATSTTSGRSPRSTTRRTPAPRERLREVCEQVAARHDVVALAACTGSGHLEVGDLAVVLAASARHRGTAFEAARDLIDTLKSTVPIWKHQAFGDGGQEWVGLP